MRRVSRVSARRGLFLRATIVFALIGLWIVLLAARLAQLALFADDRLDRLLTFQGEGAREIALARGVIYDRNLEELAVSIGMDSIYANPRLHRFSDAELEKLAVALEPLDRIGRKKRLRELLDSKRDKSFVWVERKASDAVSRRVREAKIDGIGFAREARRFYPNRDLGSRVIGFCGIDNQGLSGIEYYYDELIEPVSSKVRALRDALGRSITDPDAFDAALSESPPDLILNIDARAQYITERALERQVKKSNAKGGVAILLDPKSGAVIALGEEPKFNSNTFERYPASRWNSMSVNSMVEPGSTMKIFLAAAALDSGELAPDDLLYCENGSYEVGGHVFGEAARKKYGYLSLSQTIEKSSNICAIKIAERIGAERYHDYLAAFGFGQRLEIDLPGAGSGLLKPIDRWSGVTMASMSFGQEIGVTPMQLAVGVAAIANGGYLVKPRVAAALARDGVIIKRFEPEVMRRVISSSTARKLRSIMRRAVTRGTGQRADARALSVAGKTGTAQKIDPATGLYSETEYLSSFVGFAPSDDPKLVAVVLIDEPTGAAWGGSVAGPVFAEIMSKSFSILKIPTQETKVYELDWRAPGKKKGGSST